MGTLDWTWQEWTVYLVVLVKAIFRRGHTREDLEVLACYMLLLGCALWTKIVLWIERLVTGNG